MIKYFNGTIFNIKADAIVNTVNTVGVMGAGLALEFALRYPQMYSAYKQKCDEKSLCVGELMYYQGYEKIIINFPTKWHFRYPSKIEWIEKGLKEFVKTYKKYNVKTVAFPKLGTLNGGLSWLDVKELMEKYLEPLDILIYICLDTIIEPQGKEAEMVDTVNSLSIDVISSEIQLTKKQAQLLKEALPIDRFWKINEIEGIGVAAYTKIFNYCYNNKNSNKTEQTSFFDQIK